MIDYLLIVKTKLIRQNVKIFRKTWKLHEYINCSSAAIYIFM